MLGPLLVVGGGTQPWTRNTRRFCCDCGWPGQKRVFSHDPAFLCEARVTGAKGPARSRRVYESSISWKHGTLWDLVFIFKNTVFLALVTAEKNSKTWSPWTGEAEKALGREKEPFTYLDSEVSSVNACSLTHRAERFGLGSTSGKLLVWFGSSREGLEVTGALLGFGFLVEFLCLWFYLNNHWRFYAVTGQMLCWLLIRTSAISKGTAKQMGTFYIPGLAVIGWWWWWSGSSSQMVHPRLDFFMLNLSWWKKK